MSALATPEATGRLLSKHPNLAQSPLGSSGLSVSQAGFGCYRVSVEVEGHREALALALRSGINLIDTSANYTDGDSELLVGQVLNRLIQDNELDRQGVVVVSKGGYLQGENLARAREQALEGKPYADTVAYDPHLEHCIHPDFLRDQISQSLKRLELEALDVYLLHNPEYYLAWAAKEETPLDQARAEYYRRIKQAFAYLEQEVQEGRIGRYGISSNTFVNPASHPEFTSLDECWQAAQELGPGHHFQVVQFPLNLLETGAITEKNHSNGLGVLETASGLGLGVLINRPLNAVSEEGLVRLAEVQAAQPPEAGRVMELLKGLLESEGILKTKLLPNMDMENAQRLHLGEHLSAAQALLGSWQSFSGPEHWRALQEQYFVPRLNAVLEFLAEQLKDSREGLAVLDIHVGCVQDAFKAITTWHLAGAAERIGELKAKLIELDPECAQVGGLDRIAIRAIRSTPGISSVLVGMRQTRYVEDVLQELASPAMQGDHAKRWADFGEHL